MKKLAIVGTVGVPANYGGFETLAEHLVFFLRDAGVSSSVSVYCSSRSYSSKVKSFHGARLKYIPLPANGKLAMIYDMVSIIHSVMSGASVVLLLGHGGSFVIPIIKPFTSTRFITNIDGIEWKREKWKGLAKWIIRRSEAIAVNHSHVVIADNDAIRDYVLAEYHSDCIVIPYGGDHSLLGDRGAGQLTHLPDNYALALCRIEPENNVEMILDAFSELTVPLVFVGNWDKSEYGRRLKAKFQDHPSILIHDPVYEVSLLHAIRSRASVYVHGHSAGGTNPSLVEMMHFGKPILAYDCSFNRRTTEDRAIYFGSSKDLAQLMGSSVGDLSDQVGRSMVEIARRRYTWERVGKAYSDVIFPSMGAAGVDIGSALRSSRDQ